MSSYTVPRKAKPKESKPPKRKDVDNNPTKPSSGVVSSLVDELVQRYENIETTSTAVKTKPKKWSKAAAVAAAASKSKKRPLQSVSGGDPKSMTTALQGARQRSSSDSDDQIGFFDESDDDMALLKDSVGVDNPAAKQYSRTTTTTLNNIVEDYTRRVTIENSVPDNVMDMWGDKVKAAKPTGDPSHLTYRQRMSQADKVKERIERAKAAKRLEQQRAKLKQREEDLESSHKGSSTAMVSDDDDNAAALFFGTTVGATGKTSTPSIDTTTDIKIAETLKSPSTSLETRNLDNKKLPTPELPVSGDPKSPTTQSNSTSDQRIPTTSPFKATNSTEKHEPKQDPEKEWTEDSSSSSSSSSSSTDDSPPKQAPAAASTKIKSKSKTQIESPPSKGAKSSGYSSPSSGSESSSSSSSSSGSNTSSSSKQHPSPLDPSPNASNAVQSKENTTKGEKQALEAHQRQKELEERLKALKTPIVTKSTKISRSAATKVKAEKDNTSSSSSSSSSSGNSSSSSNSSSESSSSSSSSSSSTSSSAKEQEMKSSSGKKTSALKAETATKNGSPKKILVHQTDSGPEKDEVPEDIRALHQSLQFLGITPVISIDEEEEKPISSYSVAEDSYLGDLLQQREDREHLRQEELMDDAVEMYRAAVAEGAPESEALYLQFLLELKKERESGYQEIDKLQDELIAKEQEKSKALMSKSDGDDGIGVQPQSPLEKIKQKQKEKTEAQENAEKEKQARKNAILGSVDDVIGGKIEAEMTVELPFGMEAEEDDVEFETDSEGGSDNRNVAPIRTPSLKDSKRKADSPLPSKLLRQERSTNKEKKPKKLKKKEEQKRSPTRQKSHMPDDIPETVSVPSLDEEALFLDVDDEELSTERKKGQSKAQKKKVKKKKKCIKTKRRPVIDYESEIESNDWDGDYLYSSSEETRSYSYQEDRLALDQAAADVSQREAAMILREAKQTRIRMIAASIFCFVAFGLLLFFVLDPLGRRDDGDPFRDLNGDGQQRILLRGNR